MSLLEIYQLSKTLHIIGFITWFAGIFYLVRLFVYHANAHKNPDTAIREALSSQYSLMEGRLMNAIVMPAHIITWVGGLTMLYVNMQVDGDWLKHSSWMHGKLLLVILLTGYTHMCRPHMRRLANYSNVKTAGFFRVYNEIATIFLIAIVPLAVYKFKTGMDYGIWAGVTAVLGGLIIFMANKMGKKDDVKG